MGLIGGFGLSTALLETNLSGLAIVFSTATMVALENLYVAAAPASYAPITCVALFLLEARRDAGVEEGIVERQAHAAVMRVAHTRRLSELADERRNCCAPITPTRSHSSCSRKSRPDLGPRSLREDRTCDR
ncbi:MAG TPA: hypothetical protein VFF07_07810 [Actinomycetota bacterium]|nr:hypothetical protein [Actinomycetota bacterium]